MSGYDPFRRGPHGVATLSGEIVDDARSARRLPFDVWRPAGAPAGVCPLVLFSHRSFGHRRESSFLMTHLASHGYVVAAADHTSNTAADLATRQAAAATRTDEERDAYVRQIVADRVPDLRLLADELLGGAGGVSDAIDADQMALIGWSFGGWAAVATPEQDDRFGAVVAMVPGGSSNPLPGIIPSTLTFAWRRRAPVLFLAAEHDRYTPLEGIEELLERATSPAVMFVLRGADHGHFGDEIETELPSREQAHDFTRGLALAHLDGVLRDDATARGWLRVADRELTRRGVHATRRVPRRTGGGTGGQ